MIKLPPELSKRLNQDQDLATIITNNLLPFASILKGKLYFFPDYTDHSITHNEEVLASIEHLVSEDTLKDLSPADIGVLVTAVALHDIGMHTNAEMFKNLIDGKYDIIPGNWFEEEPSWKELWHDYLKESHYWDATKRENVTGDADYIIDEESLSNRIDKKLKLDGSDIRFIGEFIRKHHPRLAYEIALKGYIGNATYEFKEEGLPEYFMQLSGLVARSHGINVRDAIEILKQNLSDDEWKTPSDVKVVYLMTLIRIADYLQIHPSRSNKVELSLRNVDSPISKLEHEMHEAITHIHLGNDDPERIVVQAKPQNAPIYVKIKDTVQDIQKEFDLSWAILGEVYGSKYKLRFRRIVTTITDKKKIKTFKFVPKQFGFKFNNTLPKLLIAPLYGNNPTYGVRELVQNAVDACRTRMALDKDYSNKTDFTHVTVTLDPITKVFRIHDTGIGMNIEEIEKYFLTIGSSYGNSTDWKKTQDNTNKDINNIYRSGRFGIGILAAFLLGQSITVRTKRFDSNQGYEFTLLLDQDFVQINIIDLPDCGTTIEIKCSSDALKQLDYANPRWYNWYVDANPKVEYFYENRPIKPITNLFTDYRPLFSKSSDYKDIYWQPYGLVTIPGTRRALFCNGFFITKESKKTEFSYHNYEKYLPLSFGIPALKLTDIYNHLPLNLQRSNIEANAEYDFEIDLIIALSKDYLCRFLTIDIVSIQKNIRSFFLHKSGFVFNNIPAFPYFGYLHQKSSNPYPQKYFLGKTLVHVYYRKKFDFHTWKPFITSHPEAFFTFKADYHHYSSSELRRVVDGILHDKTCFSRGICAFVTTEMIGLFLDKKSINDIIRSISGTSITCDNYTIFASHQDYGFAKELIAYISKLSVEDIPLFFLVHSIKDKDSTSPIDDFYDFIKEYAGGDMIIPYDETERRKKFAKIYKECGEEIERYREISNNKNFYNSYI